MARTRTLTELIASVRRRTNLENSEFVTDEEITEYLNEEWAELQARLTSNEGQPHFVSTTTLNIVNGTTLYALPADFCRLLRARSTVDGTVTDMEPFMEGESAVLQNSPVFVNTYTSAPKYRLCGDNIEILPVVRAFTVELRYISACPVLISGADTVDGFNGYEQAILAGACALVREKEETDPSFFLGRKERIYRLIDGWTSMRDASHPERVTDVTGGLDFNWWSWP